MSAPTILVVEDDAAVRQGIVDALTFSGYEVISAPDGRAGREAALTARYDLLLLDLILPHFTGFEILEALQGSRAGQAVIILSAKGECRVDDLRKHFSVSHVTVSRILARLQREGLVKKEAYRPVSLTKKGKRLADQSRERHQVVLEFLIRLGVSPEVAEMDAEGIEHHVSEETLELMRRFSTK